jgi:phosphopantetheinyl transferase
VWALKEAGLKLHGGGILMPGLRSVRVESLEPARVANPSTHVALYRLPHTAVAVARASRADLARMIRERTRPEADGWRGVTRSPHA